MWIQPPFFCDYGYNIEAGEKVFFNFNCVILEVMKVCIGSRTLFGPNVQLYTATHPLHFQERASGLEYAKPIVIGEDVWVGGSVVICPGVIIGNRSVVGAGSVVTRDIPDDVFVAASRVGLFGRLTNSRIMDIRYWILGYWDIGRYNLLTAGIFFLSSPV